MFLLCLLLEHEACGYEASKSRYERNDAGHNGRRAVREGLLRGQSLQGLDLEARKRAVRVHDDHPAIWQTGVGEFPRLEHPDVIEWLLRRIKYVHHDSVVVAEHTEAVRELHDQSFVVETDALCLFRREGLLRSRTDEELRVGRNRVRPPELKAGAATREGVACGSLEPKDVFQIGLVQNSAGYENDRDPVPLRLVREAGVNSSF